MMSDDRTLILDRVTKRFGALVAVESLSLEARGGRIFGMLGPNGAGKTTTLRMIVNIIAPDAGVVKLGGRYLDAARQDRIGYLPEERGLYKRMRVREQLIFFARLKGLSGPAASAATALWLDKLGLSSRAGDRTGELSKGLQQKIQFTTAVIHRPDLIILDEPFAGLDPCGVAELEAELLELRADGRTIILSTHQLAEAEKLCDDICLIDRARKVLDGSLAEIRRQYGHHRTVMVRAEGDLSGLLAETHFVADLRRRGEEWEVGLADAADAQALWRWLTEAGVRVSKFVLAEPSLHEIFLAAVRRPPAA